MFSLCSCLFALFSLLSSFFCSHLSSFFCSHPSSVCSLLFPLLLLLSLVYQRRLLLISSLLMVLYTEISDQTFLYIFSSRFWSINPLKLCQNASQELYVVHPILLTFIVVSLLCVVNKVVSHIIKLPLTVYCTCNVVSEPTWLHPTESSAQRPLVLCQ